MSTVIGLVTRSMTASGPTWSLVAVRARTNPSRSFPANFTRTRTPGRTASAREAGTA
ncbi:Uncharacterised protein [Mycobacteroides abscessus subsp. abscessus]|nr:Uncharacterised protein [Mycobacteroides abscessus subsp. abscessus]